MPVYRFRTVLDVARNVKAFLSVEAGVARGEATDREGELARARNQMRAHKRRLKELRGRLSDRNRRLQQARRNLAESRRAGSARRGLSGSIHVARRDLAFRYLKGSGIEIGALHQPLEVPDDVEVRYLDRQTTAQLREHYKELAGLDLMEVDIVDDGETMPTVPDASVDFVIANHMVEHCQNIIATMENHLRVLKPGGVYFLAVPDKRFTFDSDRSVTPLEDMVRDYHEGPLWSRDSHYEDWARAVEKVSEDGVATRTRALIEDESDIHFHVWTQTEFLRLILYCQSELPFSFDVEVFQQNHSEVITVLRKKSED